MVYALRVRKNSSRSVKELELFSGGKEFSRKGQKENQVGSEFQLDFCL